MAPVFDGQQRRGRTGQRALYQNAVPLPVEAIKTLKAKVDKLRSENAERKKQNAQLAEPTREIAKLKKQMAAKSL